MTGRTFSRDYERLHRQLREVAPADEAAAREERMRWVVDLLWDALHDAGVSWVGFYCDRPCEPDDRRLVLGPCRDRPACSPIGLHGACGRSLLTRQPLIVRDVAELGSSYIACDPRDRSELVIPLIEADGSCTGVLDLDSWDIGSFDESDVRGLDRLLVAARLTIGSVNESAPE